MMRIILKILFVASASGLATVNAFVSAQRSRLSFLDHSHHSFAGGHNNHANARQIVALRDSKDPEFIEYLEQNEYLEQKKRKNLLEGIQLFSGLSVGDKDRLVAVMETAETTSDEDDPVVVRQGDKGDSMYIIEEGQFEVYKEDTGEILALLSPGQSFGELSLLYEEKRAASVRPTGSGKGKLLKISHADFEQAKADRRKNMQELVEGTMDYDEYFDKRRKIAALKKCRLFSKIDQDDFSRIVDAMVSIEVEPGEVVIRQGDIGEEMFFVKSGEFDVYTMDGKNEQNLATLCENDFFGELALLFQQPRAAFVRASANSTEATQLWTLNKANFLEAVQSSPLFESTIEYLEEKYQAENIWSFLSKLSPGQIYELAVTNSRPKKMSVSFHSTLSTLALGAFLCSLVPIFQPGYDEVLHTPRIFKTSGSIDDSILQSQLFACSALTITGAMGMFRLPPRSPDCRSLFFGFCALINLCITLMAMSNFGSFSHCLIDCFKAPWKFILPTALTVLLGITLKLLDDAIVGEMRGRDSIPFAETRISASILWGCQIYLITTLLHTVLIPFYFDKTVYNEIYVQYIMDAGLEASSIALFVPSVGQTSFLALISTLSFEKKITSNQAKAAVALTSLIFFWDTFVLIGSMSLAPEIFLSIDEAGADLFLDVGEKSHIYEIMLGATVLTVLNALRKAGVFKAD